MSMTASNLTPTRSESNCKTLLSPKDFRTRAGISRSTMFDLIRKGELRPEYSKTGRRLLVGFEPKELQKYPAAFETWLLGRQPAQARKEPESTVDLVELGDGLAELVERCAHF